MENNKKLKEIDKDLILAGMEIIENSTELKTILDLLIEKKIITQAEYDNKYKINLDAGPYKELKNIFDWRYGESK